VPIDEVPPSPPGDPAAPAVPTVWAIGPSIARADIPGLCERLARRLLPPDPATGLVVCDVGAITDPDAVTIEALARLQLTAQRLGHNLLLYRAGRELLDLLTLTGLGDILPLHPGLRLQPWRPADPRNQPTDDPAG
jgi:hypothetical protein